MMKRSVPCSLRSVQKPKERNEEKNNKAQNQFKIGCYCFCCRLSLIPWIQYLCVVLKMAPWLSPLQEVETRLPELQRRLPYPPSEMGQPLRHGRILSGGGSSRSAILLAVAVAVAVENCCFLPFCSEEVCEINQEFQCAVGCS